MMSLLGFHFKKGRRVVGELDYDIARGPVPGDIGSRKKDS